ncbi:MAG: hypothetical protein AAFO58_05240 [Pseudomonadota bacterium]
MSNIPAAAAVSGMGMAVVDDVDGSETTAMTSLQADQLRVLCEKTGEVFQEDLTQAQAKRRFMELEEKAGVDVDGDGHVGHTLG